MDDQVTISSDNPNDNTRNEDKIIVQIEDQATDPRNPQNWSKSKKWRNFAVVFCNAFTGYFSATIYMPAVHDLMKYFNANLTTLNATIALYVLAMAIAPLFWAPLSQRIGRRPVYIVSIAMYTVATIVCGIANNLAIFFVFRILQGISSSAGMAIGGGSLAEMFPMHQRGRAMSLFTIGTLLGPAIAPLMGGYIAQYLGWRWIFYISTMIGGAILLADIFIMRETLYNPSALEEKKPETLKERLNYLKFNPFQGVLLLLHPDITAMALPMSVSFGCFFFLVSEVAPTYLELYHFDQGSMGLLYITSGVGNVTGALIAGFMADKYYIHLRSKAVDGVVKPERRLMLIFFCIPLIVGGHIMYGWVLHAQLHWFIPLIGYLLVSIGTVYSMVISTNYLVEAHIEHAASITAIASSLRNLMAMIFAVSGAAIRAGLGDGWTFTLTSLINVLFYAVLIPIVLIYAERIRNSRP